MSTNQLSLLLLFLLAQLLFSCETIEEKSAAESTETHVFEPVLTIDSNASLPRLTKINQDQLILSYVKMGINTDSLFYRTYSQGKWGDEKMITSGSNWFVNWADYPSVVSFDTIGKKLSAHWLQYSGEGTYDYDISMKTSSDAGETWSESFTLNQDGIPAEHGFVSFASAQNNELAAVWLDGRFTKTATSSTEDQDDQGHGHGHGSGGAMTLRAATVSPLGVITKDVELDHRICDCCQTDLVTTTQGQIAVYRDRSDTEVRDIYFVHNFSGEWSLPQAVFDDNWLIKGCPVNGPSIASNGKQTATTWYTQANDTAKVQLAFWNQRNSRFDTPIRIDDGTPLGRVSVAMGQDELVAHVSWLEQTGTTAEVRYKTVSLSGQVSSHTVLTKNDGSRSTGFPQLESLMDELMVCYTAVAGEGTSVNCVSLRK